MNKRPLRLLLTNDDGINARGIKILEEIAREITDDVWVVAPQEQQSGKGHSLTYRDPLRLKQLSEQHYTVDGTPTDCVILALNKLFAEHKPDFVLSGINNGENIGESITHSGTIGAAMEATLHGIPSIALSQVSMEAYPTDWSVSKAYGLDVIKQLIEQEWPRNSLLNVNFPHVPAGKVQGVRVVRHGRRSQMGGMVECVDPRGKPYYWVGVLHNEVNPPENTDIFSVMNGYVSVTPIRMDFTDYDALEDMTNSINLDYQDDLRKVV